MWGPLQLKPPTDHPVLTLQCLSCHMGWGSILLKPLCFSFQPPLYTQRPPELLKDLYEPLCVYCVGISWVIFKSERPDDAMHAHCYPSCACYRVERLLQDHVRRLASPVDIGLPIYIPREVEMCFIQKQNVSQKVRHIFNHVGDPFTHFHSLLHYELLSAFVSLGFCWGEGSGHQSVLSWVPDNAQVLASSPHWLFWTETTDSWTQTMFSALLADSGRPECDILSPRFFLKISTDLLSWTFFTHV